MKFPPLVVAGLLAIAMIAAPITALALTSDDPPDDERRGTHSRSERAADGREHGQKMRKWAKCVAEARRGEGQEKASTNEACGERPVPPGLLKRTDQDSLVPPGMGHRKHPKLHKEKDGKDKDDHGRGMPRGPDRE